MPIQKSGLSLNPIDMPLGSIYRSFKTTPDAMGLFDISSQLKEKLDGAKSLVQNNLTEQIKGNKETETYVKLISISLAKSLGEAIDMLADAVNHIGGESFLSLVALRLFTDRSDFKDTESNQKAYLKAKTGIY
ncbi:MAG TPA: hypothetical protein VGE63_01785 [Candidatus Paceibacterota bacterium]